MSVSKLQKGAPRGSPAKLLSKVSSPWCPRDESTGLFPPLNLPVMHISIDDRPYPIFCPEKLIKMFVEGKENDVFVATYARSGTTLTLSICREIHLLHNVNLPEDHPLLSDKPNVQTPWIYTDLRAYDPDKMPSPRVFKTHCFYQHLDIDSEKTKVIHVFRNPKDVVCSLYPHIRNPPRLHFFDFQGTFSDCVNWFLNGGLTNGCYWKFNKEYFTNEKQYKILHVSYEELTLRKSSAIQRINSFLGYKDLDEQQIAFVDKATSLDPGSLKPDQFGKPGKALNMLSVEQRNKFDERCQKEFDGISEIPASYSDEKVYLNQC